MANFSELDRYLFGQATHYEIYRKLGAHFTDQYGIRGVCFDVGSECRKNMGDWFF